jgi:hypothetical protein
MRNVLCDAGSPSEYRHIQKYVAHSLIKEIVYTPPSPLDAPTQMADLVKWQGIETGRAIRRGLAKRFGRSHTIYMRMNR